MQFELISQKISNLWQQSTTRYPLLSLLISSFATYYTGWPLLQGALMVMGSALAAYGLVKIFNWIRDREFRLIKREVRLISKADEGFTLDKTELFKRLHRTFDEQTIEAHALQTNSKVTATQKKALQEAVAQPSSIYNLLALNQLLDDINMGLLPALPPIIPTLVDINLQGCGLTRLPQKLINQLIAYPVISLDISNNLLSSLPESIDRLALRELWAHNNQLKSLPGSIGSLGGLIYLGLRNNLLSSLPYGLRVLRSLTHLDLHNNRLSSLPYFIGELESLRELHVSANLLTTLPLELSEIETLSTLEIFANKFSILPAALRPILEKTRNQDLFQSESDASTDPSSPAIIFQKTVFEVLEMEEEEQEQEEQEILDSDPNTSPSTKLKLT